MKFLSSPFFTPIYLLLTLVIMSNCASKLPNKTPSLQLLDIYEIPFEKTFKNTTVGGLSGIDYDQKSTTYYIISDDRSEKNPARIYQARLHIHQNKIDSISFNNVIFLRNKSQEFFNNYKINPETSIDPEDVRYDARSKRLFWSSEGDRIVNDKKKILQNPSIIISDLSGNYVSEFSLPEELKVSSEEKGPRRNGVLEGLSFNKKRNKIFTNVEEPLYQDGEKSSLEKGGIVRFFEFDVKKKENTKQFFYQLDPIAKTPIPKDGFSVNGISGILNYNKNRFLVIERSYSVGTASSTIKIFDFDLNNAQNVADNTKPIKNNKKLVLNLNALGIYIDNIEGITFGPTLDNGKKSIILISDNNFSKDQKTQVFLFQLN